MNCAIVVARITIVITIAWLFGMSFGAVRDACRMPPSFLPPRLDFDNYYAVLDVSAFISARAAAATRAASGR